MSKEVSSCFAAVFRTLDGKRVLEQLEKQFPERVDMLDDGHLKYYAGQRKVIHYIKLLTEKGKNE